VAPQSLKQPSMKVHGTQMPVHLLWIESCHPRARLWLTAVQLD
jgi:hypothetical protein